MRNLEDIQSRARQLVEAELAKRYAEGSRRLPVLCVHNHRQPVDLRKTLEGDPNPNYNLQVGPTVGFCLLEGPGNLTICEDAIDAQTCATFTPLRTREGVLRQFQQDLSDPDWVQQHLPQLHSLLWVLEVVDPPKPSLWFRIWSYLTRRSLEPLRPKIDPVALLEGL